MITRTIDEWEKERRAWCKRYPILAWLKYNIYYPSYRLWNNHLNPRLIYREIKWFIQRGYRGWADCDVWSIDYYLNRIMPEMLERLAKTKCGHPIGLSDKRWKAMLLKQAYNYRQLSKALDECKTKETNHYWRQIHRFLKNYYFHLWD